MKFRVYPNSIELITLYNCETKVDEKLQIVALIQLNVFFIVKSINTLI